MRKIANNVGAMSFLDTIKEMAKQPAFIAAMAAPVAGLAIGRGEEYLLRRRRAQDKAYAYKEMLDLHPHLQGRDQSEVSRIYNSLHNVSPHMARDPMVAGAWVDNIIETKVPGMNSHFGLLNAVKDLSGVQKNVMESQRLMQSPRRGAQAAETMIVGIGRGIQDAHINNMTQQKAKLESDYAGYKKDLEEREAAFEKTRAGASREIHEGHARAMNAAAEAVRNMQEDAHASHKAEKDWLHYQARPTPGGVSSFRSARPEPVSPSGARRRIVEMPKTSSDLGSILRALRV